MTQREWKIGDWASGGTAQKRWLVVDVDDCVVRGVSLGDGFVTELNRNQITHLPNCTGWDWQPPKPQPKVRPMTRAEFLAAWKQRGFCPLIDSEDDIDIVLGVIDEPTEFDPDIVNTDKHGWLSLDVLSGFKFASDETYLTVEE